MSIDSYVATRRQLRGIAESLIAGPQYRASGTIRLAVRPAGFVGVALPIEVRGGELLWGEGKTALAGPVGVLAHAAGVIAGPPDGVYEIADPLCDDDVIDIDPESAELAHRCLYAGGFALTTTMLEQHPVLWPEHFDVAVTENEVNYGVSPGDDFHPMPYAYVGPWTSRIGEFWNAPFGAFTSLDPAHDVDHLAAEIAEFYESGRAEL